MDILSELKKPLNIEEVDFRVQSISDKGWAILLAYKDARVDMNRLDAVCGTNWQKDFKTIEGNLYCGVAIKINDEWIWKWDVGTESFSDKEKGQASDAFKRACFNWGIGRELYNYPLIMVQLNPDEFNVTEYQGKKSVKQTYNFRLKEWKWSANVDKDGNVLALSAIDEKGKARFSYPRNQGQPQQQAPAQSPQKQPAQQSAPAPATGGELPWLNKMDGKEMTKNWHSIVKRITAKSLTDINIVKQHYKLSKENETELTNLIKSCTNGSN